MRKLLCLIPVVSVLALTGCTSTNPNTGPMTHAAFTAAVTLGEQFALEQHPEATPYVRAAVPVVCAVAHGTNVSPAAIMSALEAAGVTNATTKLVVNGSLALFNVVVAYLGTNQNEIRAYGQDLCAGLEAGLPPGNTMLLAKHRAAVLNSPHLK